MHPAESQAEYKSPSYQSNCTQNRKSLLYPVAGQRSLLYPVTGPEVTIVSRDRATYKSKIESESPYQSQNQSQKVMTKDKGFSDATS